jgi:hypothetical protein
MDNLKREIVQFVLAQPVQFSCHTPCERISIFVIRL